MPDGDATSVPGSPEEWAEKCYENLDNAGVIADDSDLFPERRVAVEQAIAGLIRDAVLAERERCAKVAEKMGFIGSSGDDHADGAWDAACEEIAIAIRKGP
jgi:hypothetical protein